MIITLLITVCVVLLALAGMVLFLLIRKPRVGLIVLALLMCVSAATVLTLRLTCKARLPQFADDVKKVIDPQDLQKWAVTTLKSNSDGKTLDPNDIPEQLRTLNSGGAPFEFAVVQINKSSKDSCVQLFWGGGFGHWGIDVGGPSFEQPNDNDFYIRWIPGIYFWEEKD